MSSPSFIEFGRPPFPRSDTLFQSGPLKIFPKDRTFKINTLIIIWLFNLLLQPRYRPMDIINAPLPMMISGANVSHIMKRTHFTKACAVLQKHTHTHTKKNYSGNNQLDHD